MASTFEGFRPFHLAFPVADLQATRQFYTQILPGVEGRSADTWVDFDLYGHQISAHRVQQRPTDAGENPVDGDGVPIPHFGVVLPWAEWHALIERLEAAGVEPALGPRIRFQGEVGEQATVFIRDPSGNALEFKSFRDPERLFAT
ncbi:MAG: VOC family protein [Bradymonadia bacterium]